jgi:Tfp pilus assembly protein FimT
MSQVSGKVNQASEHADDHLANLISLSRSSAQSLKTDAICQACQDRDIDKLMHFTETSGGLLNDSLRQTACKHCMAVNCLVKC